MAQLSLGPGSLSLQFASGLMIVQCLFASACALASVAARTRPPQPQAATTRVQQQGRPSPAPGADPRLQILAGLISVAVHIVATLRWTPAAARIRTVDGIVNLVSSLAVELGLLVLLPMLAPAFYQRHRRAVLGCVRIVFFSLPLMRDPQDVQSVFQGQPSSRPHGWVSDLFTLMLGARGVALLMGPLICPVPLLPHLALAAFAVQRCRTTEYMCAQPLLRHPTWRKHTAWLHHLIGKLPLIAPLQPLARVSSDATDKLHCRVLMSLLQLVLGMVAPTLLLARLHLSCFLSPEGQAVAVEAAAAAAARTGGAAEGASAERGRRGRRHPPAQRAQQEQQGQGSAFTSWEELGAQHAVWRKGPWLASLAAEAEGCLLHLCNLLLLRAGSWLASAIAWWSLASLLWGLALLLEAPQLALLPPFDDSAPGNS